MDNTAAMPRVDANPITVDAFSLDGLTLRARSPLEFAVAFAPEDGCFTATGDFQLMVTAGTREELEAAVFDALAFLWREYVISEPQDFSADALSLRADLERSFGAGDAAREARSARECRVASASHKIC